MPSRDAERPRFCSHCGNPVVVPDAIYCKDCGRALPRTVPLVHRWPKNSGTALVLSIVPGLGHWYVGHPGLGILWFLLVMFFYAAVWPLGLVMHLICAANSVFRNAGSTRRGRRANSWSVPMTSPR
ncbi:MAG TPA: hypothetical protein VFB15_01445 [Candidatus Binataceae bacterium]|jgi:hypothetical protein|nr:hypothetical protein [Candidatus Binataceae bacterium]